MNEPADASDKQISSTVSNPDGGETAARQDVDHDGETPPPESQPVPHSAQSPASGAANTPTCVGPAAEHTSTSFSDYDEQLQGLGKSPVIGPYKLLQRIGQGGMGAVYMAEQEQPVRRRVALKLIRAGMDSKQVITRFEAERQALAMMDHQNIAKVLDAGTTEEKRPYFVMELVNGIPITEYCDQYRLSVNDRLQLFMQACRAIQHAHQKGIIHRDIKPSNVLVTQHDGLPMVKVIDFGLAKALQSAARLTDKTMFTEFGQVVGTLQYMSPEQAELNALDIDTRSDVYSLGVLLYELLTGSTPIEKQSLDRMALDRVLQAIREQEPPRPSHRLSSFGESAVGVSRQRRTDSRRLCLILRGDLDWITMRALEKDRTRRYDSPVQLAEDVQRFLSNEAVAARPPSLTYRLRKSVRKHKAVFFTTAGMFLLLLLGMATTTSQMLRAREAERLADQERVRAGDEARKAGLQAEKSRRAEQLALQRSQEATAANERTSASLAKSNFHLAQMRMRQNRTADAGRLLEEIPQPHRRLEWQLANRQLDQSHFAMYGLENVTCVRFSKDGERVLGAGFGETNQIAVWSSRTGELLSACHSNDSSLVRFCCDPELSRVAACSQADSVPTIVLLEAHSGKTLKRWTGHSGEITSCSFSPDNRYLISGSRDGTVRFWPLSDDSTLRVLPGDGTEVLTLACSPHGDTLAVSYQSRAETGSRIIIYKSESGEKLQELSLGTDNSIAADGICFSPDSQRLIAADFSGTSVWNVATGEQLLRFPVRRLTAFFVTESLCCHPDGIQLASTGNLNSLEILNSASGQEVAALNGHQGPANCVAYSPDGSRLISGSQDGTVRIWPTPRHNNPELEDPLALLRQNGRFNRSGTAFLCPGVHGTLQLQNLRTGELVTSPVDVFDSVIDAAFQEDQGTVVSIHGSGTLRWWDADKLTLRRSLRNSNTPVLPSACLSDDGTIAAVAGVEGVVSVLETNSGREVQRFSHETGIEDLCLNSDGRLLAVKTTAFRYDRSGIVSESDFNPDASRVIVWDVRSGKGRHSWPSGYLYGKGMTFDVPSARLAFRVADGIEIVSTVSGASHATLKMTTAEQPCDFSPDGTRLLTVDSEGSVKLWDCEAGEELMTVTEQGERHRSARFNADGSQISVQRADGSFLVLDSGHSVESERLRPGFPSVVRLSPDRRLVAIAGSHFEIQLRQCDSDELITTLAGHTALIHEIAFTHDQSHLASAGNDGTIRIWEIANSREVQKLSYAAHTLGFSPDDSLLSAGGAAGNISVFRMDTGKPVLSVTTPGLWAGSVWFSRDGRTLLAMGSRHSAWDVSSGASIQPTAQVPPLRQNTSYDGRWMYAAGRRIDLHYREREQVRGLRLSRTRPQPEWHAERGITESQAGNLYAAVFHWAWVLKLAPNDRRAFGELHQQHNQLLARNSKTGISDTSTLWPPNSIVHEALQLPCGTELAYYHPHDSLLEDSLFTPPESRLPNDSWWYRRNVEESLSRLAREQMPSVPLPIRMLHLSSTGLRLTASREAEKRHAEIRALCLAANTDGAAPLTEARLQELELLCNRFPEGPYFSTLGICQYRLGRFDAAIQSLMISLVETPDDLDLSGPHPCDLAFLSMSHHKLGHTEQAENFRLQFTTAIQGSVWKAEPEIQGLEKEVKEMFGSH